MKKNNPKERPMTEDKFFNDVDIRNKKIVELELIMKGLEDKTSELGLPVSFIKKS
jgi:hypothetical protein